MCGFFGIFSIHGNSCGIEDSLRHTGSKLSHRGPDDEGIYSDDYWGVYFRRLSILDLSVNGHQPMLSEDGNMVLVFNGEIYNYCELKIDLQKRGVTFRSNSDTEVLLKTFQEFGPACAEQFRGMFSYVLWDRKHQELYLCRDRLGIKPLYIYQYRDKYLIASEIKCIRDYIPNSPSINEKSVFKYLARGWLDDTHNTFYDGIEAVEPGTYLKISKSGIQRNQYWSLANSSRNSFNKEEFLDIYRETLSLHLRADVEVACTLSGGMDSSSVTALASNLSISPEKMTAFSIIPPETVDESSWINKTVLHTGVSHSYLELKLDNIAQTIDEILNTHDEPFQSSSCIYQYLLRKEIARQGFEVLLVGEGGDEVLGGYTRYIYPALTSLLEDGMVEEYQNTLVGAQELTGKSCAYLEGQLKKYHTILRMGGSGQENMAAYELLNPDFIDTHTDVVNEPAYPSIPSKGQNLFLSHLIQHLFVRDIPYVLRMEDRNSMAHGIEARVPFLDHKFIEYIFSHHHSEFMKNGLNKAMLRKSMMGLLPEEVLNRKDKSPRPGNNAHLIYKVLKKDMMDILSSREFRESCFWKSDCLSIFRKDCSKGNDNRAEIWFRIYLLIRWMEGMR